MKKNKSRKTTSRAEKEEPQPKSSIVDINAGRDANIGGDVFGGSKIIINQTQNESEGKDLVVKSSWANGLFYLFIFVVVVALLGWVSKMAEFTTLIVIILAGLLAVPMIGALQLRMDQRLSEKSFLTLIRMVITQLPLISNLFKKKS